METVEKKKQQTLVVDLGDMKAPFKTWCEGRGMTPSDAVRRVLSEVMKSNPQGEGAALIRQSHAVRGEKRKRFEVSVSAQDYADLADIARREQTTVARLFRSLVRLLTTGFTPLSGEEVKALTESNRAMIALGRNVNQIARRINERLDKDDLTLAQIDFVAKEVASHRELVRALLDANERRWRH